MHNQKIQPLEPERNLPLDEQKNDEQVNNHQLLTKTTTKLNHKNQAKNHSLEKKAKLDVHAKKRNRFWGKPQNFQIK